MIRSCVPTSWGFQSLPSPGKPTRASPFPDRKGNYFTNLFQFVATVDSTPYLVVPEAVQFRQEICGGEEKIQEYCMRIVQEGASRMAEILGTEVLDNKSKTLTKCCFANVRLPLTFTSSSSTSNDPRAETAVERGTADLQVNGEAKINAADAPKIVLWLMSAATREFDTLIPTVYHAGAVWARSSGQIYNEIRDFEWGANVLQQLCERIRKGEGRE